MIVEDRSSVGNHLACYYKRCTPRLDGHPSEDDLDGAKTFYRVAEGATFLAFADQKEKFGGFARDLVIDYARLSYSKGHIVALTPERLGFWPFERKQAPDRATYFRQMVEWHRNKIKETFEWAAEILSKLPAE